MNYSVSLFFFTLWLVMVVCVFSPKSVGEWQAHRDVGYEKSFPVTVFENMYLEDE
jgi:hypothetical protein